MGRPRIGTTLLTPAERQRRHRAKLAAYVAADDVLDRLRRDYYRSGVNQQPAIRAGMRKLLAQWEKEEAARERAWQKAIATKTPRKKRA